MLQYGMEYRSVLLCDVVVGVVLRVLLWRSVVYYGPVWCSVVMRCGMVWICYVACCGQILYCEASHDVLCSVVCCGIVMVCCGIV